MQLRRSPGGNMLKSCRRRPEDPPSSVTVTTAARSEMLQGTVAGRSGEATWRLSPRSKVESPVPPPIATIRRARDGRETSGAGAKGSTAPVGIESSFVDEPGFTKFLQIPAGTLHPYGSSGYSNSVNRGSSTMLWKSLSDRAWSRFFGFSSIACARLSRQSWVLPVME
jgi:hypothetical protein